MRKLRKFKRQLSILLLLVFSLIIGLISNGTDKQVDAKTDRTPEDFKELLSEIGNESQNYKDYLKQYDISNKPDVEYIINAKDYVRAEDIEIDEYKDFEGMEGTSLYTGEKGFVEYEVDIKEEGFYDISLLYYPIEGKSASIQRGIFIDGELPYDQLSLVELSRIWVDDVSQWETDNRGNDIKPKQIEAPEWLTSYLYDSEGYETDRLSVYLTRGSHTITIYSRREPMVLNSIILNNLEDNGDYKSTKEIYDGQGISDTTDQLITIHAEHASRKSSQMLYPSQDKSSPAVYPYSAKELKNNTIGSNSSWRIVGQWLEWDFEVPESGYYNITLHARQNFVRGIYTSRKISIDGIVPFDEMKDYGFNYKSKWTMTTLNDGQGENYRFYLEEGKHTLKMEVVLGDFSDIVSNISDALLDINSVYRKVIRITGVEPDKYRDYNITKSIPGLVDELVDIRERIATEIIKLQEVAGKGSDREAALVTMVEQLDYLTKDIERFPKILGSFKQDASALGTWITGVLEQPLALDTIYIHSPSVKLPKLNDTLWDRFVHMIKTLYYSFVIDYNTIGNVAEDGEEEKAITIWIGSGRDQANVVKELIDETFTPITNINVNVQLVDMGTLLQATLAGQGPDVAIQVGNDLPMNYGLRNAVVDLSEFDDLLEVQNQFRESALVPYEFDGMTYGLPETETCLMMFYRRDILKELNLEVPQTWDEMKVALSVLSKNNMDLGMLPTALSPQQAEQVFAMLLYQNGGEYYNEDGSASVLDNDIGISVFKEYTEYYTDYKLDMEAPVDQRFRTGEAPIVISDFTLYNQLQVSAPDIKGLWGFSMVPGTVKDNGEIDYSVSSMGSAAIMMSQTKDKDSSWEFMKWWVSTETQTQYAREMEALMGASARYPTANIEAFANLPWPTEDYEALIAQFEWVKGIPQVPGGYFSWRNVSNAFYKVVNASDEKKMMPREALTDYVRYINEEITFKRKEFGLTTAGD